MGSSSAVMACDSRDDNRCYNLASGFIDKKKQ